MKYDVGMLGLGVMGRNLALNLVDHGFSVVGFDLDKSKVEEVKNEKNPSFTATTTIQEFTGSLKDPKVIIFLVPAGAPVDSAIESLLPHLQKGDILIDGGNSYFRDTDQRAQKLSQKGIFFFGVGISGGEYGARHGPSMMPGGPKEGYEKIRPYLEAAAAKVNNEPCVKYLGNGSAGHFVKMVHNGIEYGIMQIISETYDLMKRGLGLPATEISAIYEKWNKTELNSYLLEITSKIFTVVDQKSNKPLIDEILDVAKQKGTGMWTSQMGMEFQVPIPTIDIAVMMRDISMDESQRTRAQKILDRPILQLKTNKEVLLEETKQALYAAMIIVYAQGFSLLSVASQKLNYQLNIGDIATIWRGGCIIRAKVLESIRTAYKNEKDLPNILLDPTLSEQVMSNEESLRHVCCTGAEIGIPLLGFMSALGYLDSYRSAWLPTNLIQAQRDFFGSHTYERVDAKGAFHTVWEKE